MKTPEIREACYRLRVVRSAIHRWGVVAAENIPAGRKVIEYSGEKVSRHETRHREDAGNEYLFELNAYWTVDGTVGGSGAEWINHSCEPNLQTRILKDHILYFSRRRIRSGEELTVDYHWHVKDPEYETFHQRCRCGSKKCRGTINEQGKKV
jgi:SET domain-containing protein